MDFGSLSDDELAQMLRDYGADVGPVNVATRSTYERKLLKLKTGETKLSQSYDPVDDDDDDEVELRMPSTSTPSGRGVSSISTPSAIPVPTSSYSPATTQIRSRREVLDHSAIPRVDSRPTLSSARKVTREAPPCESEPAVTKTKQESKGIPTWVKLVVLLVMIVLAYLIYSNMEETATSNIPHLPNKIEV